MASNPTIIFERWQQQWLGLQLREQRMITGGILILLLAGSLLLINHFIQVKNDLLAQQQTLTTQFEWIIEQAELTASLGNNCPSQSLATQSPIDSLQELAQTQQLTVKSLESFNNQYKMSVQGNNGNNILRLAHLSSCLGFELHTLSVTNIELESNQYEAQLDFNY